MYPRIPWELGSTIWEPLQYTSIASGIRMIRLASSHHNLYDLYLLLCVQC